MQFRVMINACDMQYNWPGFKIGYQQLTKRELAY